MSLTWLPLDVVMWSLNCRRSRCFRWCNLTVVVRRVKSSCLLRVCTGGGGWGDTKRKREVVAGRICRWRNTIPARVSKSRGGKTWGKREERERRRESREREREK